MAQETEKKQDRICQMIEKFREIPPDRSDTRGAGNDEAAFLTMAIVYDSVKSAYHQGKEGIVSAAIENEIKNKYPRIRLVERKEFDIVLEELNLALSPLVPRANKLQPELLSAKLILFVETRDDLVLTRLIDTETGESLSFPIKELESGRIASQNLSQDILKSLKSRYSAH